VLQFGKHLSKPAAGKSQAIPVLKITKRVSNVRTYEVRIICHTLNVYTNSDMSLMQSRQYI
jgi:hypothetical protein